MMNGLHASSKIEIWREHFAENTIEGEGRDMDYKIKGYEPAAVFRYFEEVSAIPRGSGNEKAISDYLAAFAKEHGLEYEVDEIYNVVIRKTGSSGSESLEPVMLQGHTDMVCEKNHDVAHDFETEGIDIIQEGGFVRANGTTLGADNGIAVAYMLAILADDTLAHPPLECVFTVQEETGLTGAARLDKTKLRAKTMINLDSEEEDVATVSCAGGLRAELSCPVSEEACGTAALHIAVRGLLGGHSGAEIHLQRGNANKIMARILCLLSKEVPYQLISLHGGNKDNAIPRECDARIALENETALARAKEWLSPKVEQLREEFCPTEADFDINIISVEAPAAAVTKEQTKKIVNMLFLAPDGVQKKDMLHEGFVVSSLNLGVVRLEDGMLRAVFAPRSSVQPLQEEIKEQLALLGETFGCTIRYRAEYPGWQYAAYSKIREVFCAMYRKLFHGELKVEAIHAGLECGLFAGAMEGLDAIAVGPTLRGCHTPDETMDLQSCVNVWNLLLAVLEELTKPNRRIIYTIVENE